MQIPGTTLRDSDSAGLGGDQGSGFLKPPCESCDQSGAGSSFREHAQLPSGGSLLAGGLIHCYLVLISGAFLTYRLQVPVHTSNIYGVPTVPRTHWF